MQNIIQNLDSDKVFVLGTVTTNNEMNQKNHEFFHTILVRLQNRTRK